MQNKRNDSRLGVDYATWQKALINAQRTENKKRTIASKSDDTPHESDDLLCESADILSGAIINLAALAKILGKHPKTIKEAVNRGELPPPARFMGKRTWTVQRILAHLEKRLDQAGKGARHMGKNSYSYIKNLGHKDLR